MTKTELGCWVDLASPQVADILGGSGLDYAVIDLEHGCIGVETAQTLIMIFKGHGVAPILRIPDQSEAWIKRMLDAGASGLIVPKVDTADQARAVLAHATYAPNGTRGEAIDIVQGARWGRDADQYRDTWTNRPRIAVQIETRKAFANVAEIAAIDGLDELFFGPADYAASLNVAKDAPEVMTAAKATADIARAAGKHAGIIIYKGGDVTALHDAGYDRIAVGSDIVALRTAIDTAVSEARNVVQGH